MESGPFTRRSWHAVWILQSPEPYTKSNSLLQKVPQPSAFRYSDTKQTRRHCAGGPLTSTLASGMRPPVGTVCHTKRLPGQNFLLYSDHYSLPATALARLRERIPGPESHSFPYFSLEPTNETRGIRPSPKNPLLGDE